MKTLFITEWFMPDVGGSITIYDNVYRKYGPGDIFVLTRITKGCKDYDKKSGISTYRIPYITSVILKPESLLIYIGFFIYAVFLILVKRIKVIHCDQVLRAGLVAFLVHKILRIPYVIYAHGEEITLRALYNRNAMKRIYNAASLVIANSNNTKNLLSNLGVERSKIEVIYPGVDTVKFNPELDHFALKKRYSIESNPVLLTVGRLEKRKGHDMVIKSLPTVLKKIPNLVYLIAGKGKEEDRLKSLVQELHLEKNVIFAGEIDYDELPLYYCSCDVFIMANRELKDGNIEGFGIVFIEAAACGKPVIAGDSGGAREAVMDGVTGFVVNPNDIKSISEKIITLLENSSMSEQMGSKGRRRVESEFDWDEYYRKTKLLEKEIVR